jgi:hypothetical protein
MKISNERPPLFEAILAAFPGAEAMKPVFCYGDIIYNPFGTRVGLDLIEHEKVHSYQQGADPKKWWIQYINDPEFRLTQEIEAYGTQYAFIKQNVKDREAVYWALTQISKALASEMYGISITPSKAQALVLDYAKTVKFKKP